MAQVFAFLPSSGEGKVTIPLDRAPQHAAALGRLLGHWAYLEYQLITTLSVLLKTDFERSTVTWQEFQTTRGKISLMRRLNACYTETRREELEELLQHAERLNTERNKFVHALWVQPVGDRDHLVRVRNTAPGSVRKISHESQKVSARDIEAIVDQIGELSLKLALWGKIGE